MLLYSNTIVYLQLELENSCVAITTYRYTIAIYSNTLQYRILQYFTTRTREQLCCYGNTTVYTYIQDMDMRYYGNTTVYTYIQDMDVRCYGNTTVYTQLQVEVLLSVFLR